MASPPSKEMSLKALELFQICARQGSLQAASDETGLAVSTISHHLKGLEAHLGVPLFDHTRRPMVLTPKGHGFLRNIEHALQTIRKAKAEASSGGILEASHLRIGSVEDVDSDILPKLAASLQRVMPKCALTVETAPSHTIIAMLRNRELDVGLTATPTERMAELTDRPLLRDPFVIAVPRHHDVQPSDIVEDRTPLPFLRFSSNLLMARQIDAQLRRIGVSAPHRFECGNSQTLMAMVAAGAGWTITTPLLFARARRFQDQVRLHRFPGKSFARTLALVSTPDCARSVLDLLDQQIRELIADQVVTPVTRAMPWLGDGFYLRSE